MFQVPVEDAVQQRVIRRRENHLKNRGEDYIHIKIDDLSAGQAVGSREFPSPTKTVEAPYFGTFRGAAITF